MKKIRIPKMLTRLMRSEPRRILAIATLAGALGIGVVAALFGSGKLPTDYLAGNSHPPATHTTPATAQEQTPAVDCVTDPEAITHGPRVGAIEYQSANDYQSVKLWVRTCQPGEDIEAEVKLASEDWASAQPLKSEHAFTDANKDNTAVVHVQDLTVDTQYEYRLIVNGNLRPEPSSGRFETLPPRGAPSQFSFGLITDLHSPQEPVLTQITNLMSHNLKFLQMNGDNIVAETYPGSDPDFQHRYEAVYRQGWLMDGMPQLFANLPTFMNWDDHEVIDNWSGGTNFPYADARAAYDEYVNSANPDNLSQDGAYYSFDAGQVGFFVLDTRTFRSPNLAPDGANKSMLGAAQKAALEHWLLTSSARFKFVISSVMWSDFSRHTPYGESWPAFGTERGEIFDFVRQNNVGGVILTSGDEHWTGVFKIAPWGIYEVAAGPFTWFQYPTTSSDPQILFKAALKRVAAIYHVNTFSCPATLNVQIIDATNNAPIYTLRLNEQDLGGDADGDGLVACQEQRR